LILLKDKAKENIQAYQVSADQSQMNSLYRRFSPETILFKK